MFGFEINLGKQPLLIAVQAAMPLKDMAAATASFGFIRSVSKGGCEKKY